MELISTFVLGISLALFGVLIVILSIRWILSDDVSTRIENFVADSEGTPTDWRARKAVERREFSGSLLSRTILPFFRKIAAILGRFTPAGSIESLGQQLVIAGHPYGLGPREFYGIRVGFTFFGILAGYLALVRRGFSSLNVLVALGIFLIFFITPTLWLRLRVRKRQKLIQRQLPDALDMLSVCASAGLGFDQSIQRVSEFWNTDLSLELSRVISEMEMGLSRSEALRNLANRLDVPELSSFVTLILQADQLGMSISDTLLAQAEQMRAERHLRAEEEARKIPIKMLIPMAFLIFPAIIAIIMGPAIPDLLEFLRNFSR
jgi:tight adherence protein C